MCDEISLLNSILLMTLICSVISGLFCLIIIGMYIKIGQRGGLSFHILLYMSITDLIRSISLILTYMLRQNEFICKMTAILINSSLFVNSVWSIYIIYVLHRIYLNFPTGSNFYLKTWTFCGFCLPPVLHLFPLLTDSYGFNKGSCTYKNDSNGIIWRAVSEFSMFLIVLLANFGYFKVYKDFKVFTVKQVVFEKGMIYSIIFFVTFVVLILFRFLEFFLGFCQVYPIAFMSYLLIASNGFINFLALIANKSFWNEIRNYSRLKATKSESFEIIEKIIIS